MSSVENYAPEADQEFNRLVREEYPAADWVWTGVDYDGIDGRDYLQVRTNVTRGAPIERMVRLRTHIDAADLEHSLDAARRLAKAYINECEGSAR